MGAAGLAAYPQLDVNETLKEHTGNMKEHAYERMQLPANKLL